MRTKKIAQILVALLACSLMSGCFQLDVLISIAEDGSATLTERLRFTRQLIDLAGDRKEELLKLLGKQAAEDRLKKMGEGVELTSHELREVEGGAREAVVVYHIKDLNGFQYVSPWFAYPDFPQNNMVKFHLAPLYKSQPYHGRAGEMVVTIQHVKPAAGEAKLPEGAEPPPGPTPAENQVYRDMAPLLRDMLKDVQVRLVLESYSPLSSPLPLRNRRARPTFIDLVNFSDKDKDAQGEPLLSNEEIMLDLAHWQFSSANIAKLAHEGDVNATLPMFAPLGSRNMWWLGGTGIAFRPSKALFDRYFEGKMLDFSEWAPSPKDKQVPARFESIGSIPEGKGAATRPAVKGAP